MDWTYKLASHGVLNRTIFTRDNLEVMRGMDSESVDLIYLDPPFNSNRDYAAPIGSQAAGAAFKDTWTLDDVKEEWIEEIEAASTALHYTINAAGLSHGLGMEAYLSIMAVRLLEMHRLLRPTGSVYFHCDDTASHYLKVIMDSVFGAVFFRNHIVWRRATAHNDASRFGRIVDHILFYGKSEDVYWDGTSAASSRTDAEIRASYPSRDERGAYRSDNLTGPLHGAEPGSPSTQPWRGYDVYDMGRVWSVPRTGAYAEYIEQEFVPGYLEINAIHERLDALDAAGLVRHPRSGKWPGLKRYAAADRGIWPQNLITEPMGFTNFSRRRSEYVGYPTQKPLGLIEKLILASCPPGGMVLDPFCGCATTCVAAEKLGRRWIGIDLSPKAYELVTQRLAREVMVGSDEHPTLTDWKILHRDDIPIRTDVATRPSKNIKRTLYGDQAGNCRGCGEHFQLRNLTIDHIVPRSLGGVDTDANLQLLCGACNSVKGARSQEEFLAELRRQGIRR